uniref:Uncharacterized protein n=1 Tax=mine drainage metagenome TaxID=410659 RepID=E6QMB6_9ZZZZ
MSRPGALSVAAQNAQHAALYGDLRGGHKNGVHVRIGGLQADLAALDVEALERCLGAAHQRDDNLSLAGGAGALDQHVIAAENVLVAHRVAANFESEDILVPHHVLERDGLGILRGLNRQSGGDASEQGNLLGLAGAHAFWHQINGAAAVGFAIKQALFLEVGDVLVDGGDRLQIKALGNLFKGRGVAAGVDEGFEKVEHFFLSFGDSHGRNYSE